MANARSKPGVTVRENSDGTKGYQIRWRQGRGRGARNLSHTFDRERDAIEARNRILAADSTCHCVKHAPGPAARAPGLLPEEAPAPPALTFGEYAKRHAAALTGVGEGYRRDVIRDVDRHLSPFADRPLKGDGSITDLDVRELIRGMETGSHWWLHREKCAHRQTRGEANCGAEKGETCGRPLSPTTIRRQLAQAGAIMQAALSSGLATGNPFRGHRLARPVKDADQGMTFLSHAEWEILEQQLPEGAYRDLAAFLVGSGLRWGEATALAVGAVDLLATPPRVHVGRAWKSDGKGGFVIGSTKSARSRRTVPIAGWVRDLLIAHVAGKGDDELVFTTPAGTPIRASNYFHRAWSPAVKAARAKGLTKKPRIHDLRHSHVSWSLAEGMPMYEVSRRVGHASVQVTDGRYAHVDPNSGISAAASLEKYRTRKAD